jgi:hypothetical protein
MEADTHVSAMVQRFIVIIAADKKGYKTKYNHKIKI